MSRKSRNTVHDRRRKGDGHHLEKVDWISHYEGVGNTYGYSTLNRRLQIELAKHCQIDPEARRLAAVATPTSMNWEAIEERKAKLSLFTMWEHDDLPPEWIGILKHIDHIIVPCKHNRKVFKKTLPNARVDVCPLGVDVERFTYKERHFPPAPEKFRFLWVGAPNPRKGFSLVLKISEAFPPDSRVEFYFKSTVPKRTDKETAMDLLGERKEFYRKRLEDMGCGMTVEELEKNVLNDEDIHGQVITLNQGPDGKPMNKTITVDFRNLPMPELIALYHSAHAFIFPSIGEGFGLTLAEAMATGLPCIAPMHTGMGDFFDQHVGFPIDSIPQEHELIQHKFSTIVNIPDIYSLATQAVMVIRDYHLAKRRAKKAAERIREKYTWEIIGRRFYEILDHEERRIQ